MRAARIIAPKKIVVSDEKMPDIKDDQVMVRLLKAVICGSDFPYFFRTFPAGSYPLPPGYPGHECLGVVVKSGSDTLHEGDTVMYYPTALDGYKEYHVNAPGRFQKLPAGMDLNVLVLTQVLGAVSHCMFRIDSPYNKDVVVMGQGPVGLLFTALLKNMGARNVIAVDPIDHRLDIARIMGAGSTINPGKENPDRAVSELTAGKMADIVIDAYGQETGVINKCFDLARHNGQVAFFGICLEESPGLNFGVFFRKELRMISSVGPDLAMDYPFSLDMILKGAVDVTPLITHVMPFEEIQKGFDIAVNRADRVIKVILEF